MQPVSTNKTAIRKQYKAILQDLTPYERSRWSKAICIKLLQFLQSMQRRIRNVYAYSATEYEVDLDLFFQIAQRKGMSMWLPVIHSRQNKMLNFYRWARGEARTPGCFNILEPSTAHYDLTASSQKHIYNSTQANTPTDATSTANSTHTITTENAPDVLIIPLIAFDSAFHRLGKGGGYYDYTMAHLSQCSAAYRICCAFSAQECSNIEIDAHDISVDAIITEKRIISTQSKCRP